MYRWVVVIFLLGILLVPFAQAEVSLELEKMIQQLDWDMTMSAGQRGRLARNRAVTKLTCIGKRGGQERDRILQMVGRLLDHEYFVIVNKARQIFRNLSAEQEIDFYRQKFYLRWGAPQNLRGSRGIKEVLENLLTGGYLGLEVIRERYPTEEEALNLDKLAGLFYQETKRPLKIRLRVFSLYQPNKNDRSHISLIRGEVIEDFHIGPLVSTDSACKPTLVW